jgi:hypothetical protein
MEIERLQQENARLREKVRGGNEDLLSIEFYCLVISVFCTGCVF